MGMLNIGLTPMQNFGTLNNEDNMKNPSQLSTQMSEISKQGKRYRVERAAALEKQRVRESLLYDTTTPSTNTNGSTTPSSLTKPLR